MSLSVRKRAQTLATFRFVEIHLMEMLARWVPTTPEMEVKVLFGEHIWELAQHADNLGKRTHELRAPLHHTLRPIDRYVEHLDAVAAETDTARRLAGFHDVLLRGLFARYERYLEATDSLLDQPSVRLVESIMGGHLRMTSESRHLRDELEPLHLRDREWIDALSRADAGIGRIVAEEHQPRPARAAS